MHVFFPSPIVLPAVEDYVAPRLHFGPKSRFALSQAGAPQLSSSLVTGGVSPSVIEIL